MNALTQATLSFLVCLLTALVLLRFAGRLGLMDVPRGRRQHNGPIPRIGGLAFVATLLGIQVLMNRKLHYTTLELTCITGMAVLGFLDDRLDLRARWKAALGLAVAIALAAGATYHLDPLLGPFRLLGIPFSHEPWVIFSLLVLLFWCIPHGFNLIDGANGLATGFALVVVGSIWAAGIPKPLTVGALTAILMMNWPRAKLFLGDCGSLSIGLLLVVSAQKVLAFPDPNHLLWLFAYPIIDVTTVVVIRLLAHQPITVGDRNHLHFQLRDRWPALTWVAVPMLLAMAAMCASEIYLRDTWRMVPYAGLTMLLGLSAFLIADQALRSAKPAKPLRRVEPSEPQDGRRGSLAKDLTFL